MSTAQADRLIKEEALLIGGFSVAPPPTPRSKRALDIVVALIGLVLSAPLWLVIAAVIKLHDRGPVLYGQRRWGKGGKAFRLYKFRTMVEDSDRRFGIVAAEEDDHRVTRPGRFLRATGMDELPQLLNILKGEMSFVGPRALAVGEVIDDDRSYELIDGFHRRLEVIPGLTGPATIYLSKSAPVEEKLQQDLRYIADRSFWLDVKLIALSIIISLRGRWETRTTKI